MIIVRHLMTILEDMKSDTDCLLNSYQYNDKPTSNLVLDKKMEDITAVLFQITDFTITTNRLTVKEEADINITFLQKETKLDAQATEQDTMVDNTKDVAIDFIKRVIADNTLKILDDTIQCKSVYLRSDSNRTGVNVQLRITEKQGSCL